MTPALRVVLAAATLGIFTACAGAVGRPLPADARASLTRAAAAPASVGEQIYEGRVFSLDGGNAPLFRYERRVRPSADGFDSTHLTYDASGAIVVSQRATHTAGYELRRAELVHAQTGVTASVVVAGTRASFTLDEGRGARTFTEDVTDPVVAGPTMFGYILANWDALNRGETRSIRFAVLERGETIGFRLARVASGTGRTTIRMRAANPVLRLAIADTFFQFETETRRIVEYTGRVPPMKTVGARLHTLDARVTYQFVAPAFR